MKTTAIILAGGKSRRMGKDKAFSKWVDGLTLLEHQIERLNFFDEIIISCARSKCNFLDYKIVEDVNLQIGPIEGLRRALITSSNNSVFLISCDMPFVNKELIEYMFLFSLQYDAVVCKNGKYIEPLYAFYSKNVLDVLECNISNKKYSFRDLIFSVHSFFIAESIVRLFSPDLKVFVNINTKKDFCKFSCQAFSS